MLCTIKTLDMVYFCCDIEQVDDIIDLLEDEKEPYSIIYCAQDS